MNEPPWKSLWQVNILGLTVPCRLSCVGCLINGSCDETRRSGEAYMEPFSCLCFLSGGDIPILIGRKVAVLLSVVDFAHFQLVTSKFGLTDQNKSVRDVEMAAVFV